MGNSSPEMRLAQASRPGLEMVASWTAEASCLLLRCYSQCGPGTRTIGISGELTILAQPQSYSQPVGSESALDRSPKGAVHTLECEKHLLWKTLGRRLRSLGQL